MFKPRVSTRQLVLGSSRVTASQPDETLRVIRSLAEQFPADKFHPTLPRIVLKHQLYSACSSRQRVDQELQDLRERGLLRLFKIGADMDDAFAIVMADEFQAFVTQRQSTVSQPVLRKFLDLVLRETSDLSLTAGDNLPFDDSTVSSLVQAGLLTVRDLGCYWVACPDMGRFVRPYRLMRRKIMRTVKRCKYREILHSDLQLRIQRPSLPMDYMMHDLVGAGLLRAVQTTAGILYRVCD